MPGSSLQRRQWLLQTTSIAASLAATAWPASVLAAKNRSQVQLVSAWQTGEGYQVGVLQQNAQALEVSAALDVPTRAHGVWLEAGGTLLAVARRPGDWLLRWKPKPQSKSGQAITWGWIEPDRAFNGHVISSADGKTLYTTETNLETGEGLIGLRNTATLEKTAEWPSHGMDPHELLLDADGSLMVANGGIPALPETGRLKLHMNRMDASLVRLDTRSGRLLGQWHLADQRLSLRHIAWGPMLPGGQAALGIALQAEHDDAAAKATAPVLAIFDGQTLRAVAADSSQSLRGYGGDISFAAGLFAVSCPRANGLALWRADGQWAGFKALDEACALASIADEKHPDSVLWAAGNPATLALDSQGNTASASLKNLRIDNHWAAINL
ncbi:MAG: DUF1513 domain-containing protein [Pseudomonadota bacterium]